MPLRRPCIPNHNLPLTSVIPWRQQSSDTSAKALASAIWPAVSTVFLSFCQVPSRLLLAVNMGDLSSLSTQANHLILALRGGLELLEKSEHGGGHGDTKKLVLDLEFKFRELQKTSMELDSTWRMHTIGENASKRNIWKRKVEHVSEEVMAIAGGLEKYTKRETRRQIEKQDRDELFQRAELGRRVKHEMDEESQMVGSVQRSKRVLEEMFDTGNNILISMAGSRERLKKAQRKALDVLNTVGLGESLLKLIERRQRMDIWVTYGGMLLMVFVVMLVMWWFWF